MVAIIKKNFRLQNARDFLENLKSHPRALPSGTKAPLHESLTLSVVPNSSATDATATYTWNWKISNTVASADRTQNSVALKKDSVLGLKQSIGTHVTDRNHYLFIGKTTPWTEASQSSPSTVNPVPDLSPAPANDTLEEERRVWDEMLGLKKITDFYTSLVIPRSDWDGTKKTIYRVYDDRNVNLYGPPSVDEIEDAELVRGSTSYKLGNFYALNSEFDLFVCLQTGSDVSGLPTASQEEPRRTQSPSALIDYTAIDGYVWKYITTIRPSDASRFATDHWIPVRTLSAQEIKESDLEELNGGIPDPQAVVQKTAVPGGVVSFIVENLAEQGNNSYVTTHKGVLTGLVSAATGSAAKANLNSEGAGSPDPSDTNQIYQNMHMYITSGPGAGNVYTITDYTINGASRQITLQAGETWDSSMVAPGATTIKYEILPQITITTNGTTQAKLKPVVSNGKISSVKVVSPGANATYTKVVVHPTSGKSSSGTTAVIRAVLSPLQGLGADPEKDLGAFFVMLGAKLNHYENSTGSVVDFPVSNDYRQIGIIRDVLDKDGNLATENTYSACSALQISGITNGPFTVDERIKQTYTGSDGLQKTAYARLLDITPISPGSTIYVLTYIQTPETGFTPFKHDSIETYSVLSDRGSNEVSATINGLIVPEVKKFSGEILYLENRRAILRAERQSEDIKAIIEF